ncbi:hypothetical protein [Escherichia phage ST2]|nr:hypothetical protein [Escherichia phage ST2]
MRKYMKWEFKVVSDPETGTKFYDVKSSDGTDWYELMAELDDRDEKYVVGTQESGHVTWFTKGSVNGIYAPYEHGDVIVTDSYPEDLPLGTVLWDGSKFYRKPEEVNARTKEDIEKDLKALLAELKNMD